MRLFDQLAQALAAFRAEGISPVLIGGLEVPGALVPTIEGVLMLTFLCAGVAARYRLFTRSQDA